MFSERVRSWLTNLGVLTARPIAFAIFGLYVIAWITFGSGLEWHSIATVATWGMTLVIQRAEHRDAQAIQAKLDELLKATRHASNELMDIDDKDAEEVEHEERMCDRVDRLSTVSPAKERGPQGAIPRASRDLPRAARRVVDMILRDWASCRYPVEYGGAWTPLNGAQKRNEVTKGTNPRGLVRFTRSGYSTHGVGGHDIWN
jgi:low affinity Fe/Cu permease